MTRFLIYAIAAVSLDLMMGYGAMVSFGHAMPSSAWAAM
jgi:branched-chain amino acid transport system permease protein